MSSAVSGYRSLLHLRGAPAFFLTAAVGRVGLAMTGLSLLWLLHARTGSYGTAGLATAGFALAEALIGPNLARLIDRFGQPRVLPLLVLAHGAAIAGVLASTSTPAAIACATCAGAAVPQLGACSAARWADLLRAERADQLPTAFSLESLANATAFLLGPALASALGATGHAAWASILAATLVVGGGMALAALRGTAPPPTRGRASASPQRSLLHPNFVLVALLSLALGLYFGTMSTLVSAYATQHGTPGAAAPLLAASSLSGLCSGWLYGLRRHRAPTHIQLVIAAAYLTTASVLLPLAPSVICLGAAAVATEAAVPPTIVLLNVLTEKAVAPTVLTQAFTWNNSANAAGSALAASLAGHTADRYGAPAAFTLAPAAGFVLLTLSVIALRVENGTHGAS
jgi:predicted MFS family arabinose efflux permease